MNKEDLVKEVAKKTKVTQKEVGEILNSVIEVIEKNVSKGKKITLVGFGTFEAKKRASRVARNPQTNVPLTIPERTVPVFTPGKAFKTLVNKK